MFIEKMKELVASGKLSLIVRVAFITLVVASTLMFGAEALAWGPMPGLVGG